MLFAKLLNLFLFASQFTFCIMRTQHDLNSVMSLSVCSCLFAIMLCDTIFYIENRRYLVDLKYTAVCFALCVVRVRLGFCSWFDSRD